jgi:translation initiation factor IF-1
MANNSRSRKKKEIKYEFDPNMIYFEGRIIESLPGAHFKVRVERDNGLEPLVIDCDLRTIYKVKRIHLIKGDFVTVEVNPLTSLSKGTIVLADRKMYTPPPKV